jgi:hypothetical protein
MNLFPPWHFLVRRHVFPAIRRRNQRADLTRRPIVEPQHCPTGGLPVKFQDSFRDKEPLMRCIALWPTSSHLMIVAMMNKTRKTVTPVRSQTKRSGLMANLSVHYLLNAIAIHLIYCG